MKFVTKYLMIGSRPDIGFAVVKLAQQMANPSNDHYQVGLHLCRYLLATCRYQLVYNRLSNELLVAYYKRITQRQSPFKLIDSPGS